MIGSQLKTKGNFYLPEEKGRKCYGNLVIKNNEIRLDLLNGLTDLEIKKTGRRNIFKRKNIPEYKEVLGMTVEGAVVLLKNHFGRLQHFNYLTETSELFSMAFIGEEDFSEQEDLSFKELTIKYVRLKDFVNKTKITQTKEIEGSKRTKEDKVKIQADIDYKPLLSFTSKEYTFTVEASYKLFSSNNNDPLKSVYSITEEPYIRIRKKRGKIDREEIIKIIYKLRDFLAFALRDSIYPTEVFGFNPSINDKKKKLKTGIFLAEQDHEGIKESNPFQFLFTSTQIGNDLSKYISKWLELSEEHPVFYENYINFLFSQDSGWEGVILKLILAIENYVDISLKRNLLKKKKKNISKKDIKQANTKIQEISQKDLSAFLLSKVGYFLTDISFKQKFGAIYAILPIHIQKRFNPEEDVILINRVRNAIAHGGMTKELYEEAEDQEILIKLRCICEFCLMKSIGIKEEIIEKGLMRPY